MLENSVIKLTTTKLAMATIVPGSLLLIGGIIVWHLWRKQAHLQAKTDELNNELRQIKKHMADTPSTNKETPSTVTGLYPSRQQNTSAEVKNTEKMGLLEYLINDNIQLRQQA